MSSDDDFEERETSVRKLLREQARRAIALRSKDREFHGIEREFVYHQSQMILDYEKTRDLKHPRDLGDSRESILRKFLTEAGYVPSRYAVSDRSVRVASTTGHISKEIDIAFYDPQESITLMSRQDVYEVYPVETVYGVIQVKSVLTKAELISGLKNIASYKKLKKKKTPHINQEGLWKKSSQGFGVIFAYSSNISWKDVISGLEDFSGKNSMDCFPNAVFILDRGFFFVGDGAKAVFANSEIESIESPVIHGFPDRDGTCLYSFQSVILDLLRDTLISIPRIENYFRLPLIVDDYSYQFNLGAFAEIGVCNKHGDYARKIPRESLEKIILFCMNAPPVNMHRATDIAYGLPPQEEVYRRQPNEVRIYNPEELDFSEILLRNASGVENGISIRVLGFDILHSGGMNIVLPYYYSEKEKLITSCKKCSGILPARKDSVRRKRGK